MKSGLNTKLLMIAAIVAFLVSCLDKARQPRPISSLTWELFTPAAHAYMA